MSERESVKIFVDAYLLNKEHQGIRTYIKELYKEFARRNRTIEIYLGCFEDKEVLEEFKGFSNVFYCYYKSQNRLFRMFFEIPKLIRRHRFNYAHFQYVIPPFRNKSTKYIVTIHDVLFNDFRDQFSKGYRLKRNFLFKYSARKSDILCTVSKYSKGRLKAIYQTGEKEIFVTPNGVSDEFFKAYSKEEEQNYIESTFKVKNYILYVSRIEARKNQQTLVDVFPNLPKDLSLVFIGEKTMENSELDRKLNELDKETRNRIHFFNDLSEKDLISFLRGALLFAYPSLAEGFGIPPLEAGAVKIPVLCSNATAMGDFDFFTPFYINFEKDDVNRHFFEILADKDELRLGDIRETIQRTYAWSKSSKVLEQIINQ
jgi:glycosyltransferase involved in cell wall biosynthesis